MRILSVFFHLLVISISYCLDVLFERGRTWGLEGTCLFYLTPESRKTSITSSPSPQLPSWVEYHLIILACSHIKTPMVSHHSPSTTYVADAFGFGWWYFWFISVKINNNLPSTTFWIYFCICRLFSYSIWICVWENGVNPAYWQCQKDMMMNHIVSWTNPGSICVMLKTS